MNANDANTLHSAALSQLKDIHLPDPIGWWPMAFSWWVLLLSLGAMLFGAIWFWLERKRRNAYRREALQKLAELERIDATPSEQIQALNALLKQVAITVYGRSRVAPLQGKAWLAFLKQSANYIAQPEHLETALQLAYQAQDETNEPETRQALTLWRNYAVQWIKGHYL